MLRTMVRRAFALTLAWLWFLLPGSALAITMPPVDATPHAVQTVFAYDADAAQIDCDNARTDSAASAASPIPSLARGVGLVAAESGPARLFHYTNEKGLAGITESEKLLPSLKSVNPNDVRYGNGQYLSDIVPGTKTPAQLSREFIGQPFQGSKYTHYIEIDVSGLNAVQGRPGVFVIPNETPLDLSGRIIGSGRVVP